VGGTGKVRSDELRWVKEGRCIFWNCLTANDVCQANVAFFTLLWRQANLLDGHAQILVYSISVDWNEGIMECESTLVAFGLRYEVILHYGRKDGREEGSVDGYLMKK